MNKIFSFLGIETFSHDSRRGKDIMAQPAALQGKQYSRAGNMLSWTAALLNEFYAPYNTELARILQDDRFLWQN